MDVLSKNEFEIMSLLWSENRPLSRSEIIALSPQKGWKERSIHVLLNSLLAKEMIKVSGFTTTKTNIGRTFTACCTPEDYMVFLFQSGGRTLTIDTSRLFSSFHSQGMIPSDSIEELEKIVQTLRDEKN